VVFGCFFEANSDRKSTINGAWSLRPVATHLAYEPTLTRRSRFVADLGTKI
jgi:hypothetical protein